MNIRTPDSPPYAEYRRREHNLVSVFLPEELVTEVAALVEQAPRVVGMRAVPSRIAWVLVEYARRYPDDVTNQPLVKRQDEVTHGGRQLSLHLRDEGAALVAAAMAVWEQRLYVEWCDTPRPQYGEAFREPRKVSRRGMVIAACREALDTDCWGLGHARLPLGNVSVIAQERAEVTNG